MLITSQEKDTILGALDSLAAALSDHLHHWGEGEKEIYEQAYEILAGRRPVGPY